MYAPLLERLATALHCTYLSDLTFLSKLDLTKLLPIIEEIPPNAYAEHVWADAYQYILGELPTPGGYPAREEFLREVRRRSIGSRAMQMEGVIHEEWRIPTTS